MEQQVRKTKLFGCGRHVAAAVALLTISLGPSTAFSQDAMIITIGKNAGSFHQDLTGRMFVTLEARGFGDWWYRYHSMVTAMFSLTSSKPNEVDRPALRLIDGEKNAFAVIYKQQRYILLGPLNPDDDAAEMLLFGHELGHHICGHTIGVGIEVFRDRELEADRFAGAAARALSKSTGKWKYQIADLTFDSVIKSAGNLFGKLTGGATHPPAEMRVAAVRDGWLRGSDCFERNAHKVVSPKDTIGASPKPSVSVFDGNWYSDEWKYGYVLRNGLGIATHTNSPKYGVGDTIIRIEAAGLKTFKGKQIYLDGQWYKIVGQLSDDGWKISIKGEKNASWTMHRVP